MKKILALTLIGVVLSFVLASCASSKKKEGCDAYGIVNTDETTDLASK
jgi:hypothetical protein